MPPVPLSSAALRAHDASVPPPPPGGPPPPPPPPPPDDTHTEEGEAAAEAALRSMLDAEVGTAPTRP